jgi:hypothetical protein
MVNGQWSIVNGHWLVADFLPSPLRKPGQNCPAFAVRGV